MTFVSTIKNTPHKTAYLSFLLTLALSTVFILVNFASKMDIYELPIFLGSVILFAYLPLKLPSLSYYLPITFGLSAIAVGIYPPTLELAQNKFFLKYLLSSQSAVLWMMFFCTLALILHICAVGLKIQLKNRDYLNTLAERSNWVASSFAGIALLVRWYETYLATNGNGHIPVSNLYEVFILLIAFILLFYQYLMFKFKTQYLGLLISVLVLALNGFVLWYALARQAHEILPLVPALQSWWMKIHVPANFVGYATFCIAAMLGVAFLIKSSSKSYKLANYLPDLKVLDEMMHHAIAIGFAFFTLATILGAFWAADAWGGYWSWDPKEVWALIVWLFYASWLHLRLISGWRGQTMAWLAIIGLLVTSFAFMGVNLFLSGLHSYGTL